VVNEVTGLLSSSEQEMSESLRRLIDQPDLRSRMAEAAVKHVEKFDWDVITRQWQEIMEGAIERRVKNRRPGSVIIA